MARILLIDDDDLLRKSLRLTLAHFGHEVFEARNGKEGLNLLPGASPDLLITDIVMPEMEGLEVLMTLRKRHGKLKIIAISGGGRYSATDYLKTAELMGATKVLAKPFSNEVLIATVNEVLSEGGASTNPSAPN